MASEEPTGKLEATPLPHHHGTSECYKRWRIISSQTVGDDPNSFVLQSSHVRATHFGRLQVNPIARSEPGSVQQRLNIDEVRICREEEGR
jgi:hypothetical protein